MSLLARLALASVFLISGAALADPASAPPDIDCGLGFENLQQSVTAYPGAHTGGREGTIGLEVPDTWRVEFAFTRPGDPAHPAVTLRTFIKQVTGVWTSQSKGCGYGDQAAFASLMAAMKAEDKDLTDASRANVEQQKREASPLTGPQ